MVADQGYYKGLEILACEQVGITTIVPKPLTSGSKAEGRFGKQDFIYVAASDARSAQLSARSVRFTQPGPITDVGIEKKSVPIFQYPCATT